MSELSDDNKPVGILCISEHNMTSDDIQQLYIPNFKLASYFTRNNRNGGVCILTENGINCKTISEIEALSVSNVVECSAIELVNYDIIVVCMYRVPNNANKEIGDFMKVLQNILHRQCFRSKKL